MLSAIRRSGHGPACGLETCRWQIRDAPHTNKSRTRTRCTHDSSLTSTTNGIPSEDVTSLLGVGTEVAGRLVIMVSGFVSSRCV